MFDTAKTIALIKALGGGSSGGGSSGGGVLVVNCVNDTLDKTWAEINASTVPVVIHNIYDGGTGWEYVSDIFCNDDTDTYYVTVTGTDTEYAAESENGYPVYEAGGGGIK